MRGGHVAAPWLLVGLLACLLLSGSLIPGEAGGRAASRPAPVGLSGVPEPSSETPRPLPAGVVQRLQGLQGACCAKADELNQIELELLRRFSDGREDTIPGDRDLCARLARLGSDPAPCSEIRQEFPVRIWLGLFDVDVLSATPMQQALQPTLHDVAATEYLTRTLDPRWVLACSLAVRNKMPDVLNALRPSGACPPALRQAWTGGARGPGGPGGLVDPSSIEPWTGILHLLGGSYTEARGVMLATTALSVVRRFRGPIRGLRMADVGTGCGVTLPFYLQAVGQSGTLYAIEIDPFALHAARSLNPGSVRAVHSLPDSISMPPNSLDVIVLTGVHMGEGLTDRYEQATLPWLRSMRSALSRRGILVLDEDMHGELIREGIVEKIERAGFRQVAFLTGKEHPRGERDAFVAVFEVVK